MLTQKALVRFAVQECCDILRHIVDVVCNESARTLAHDIGCIPDSLTRAVDPGRFRKPRIKVGQNGIAVPFSRFPHNVRKKWNGEIEPSVHVYIMSRLHVTRA